jgi:hypothetical protein
MYNGFGKHPVTRIKKRFLEENTAVSGEQRYAVVSGFRPGAPAIESQCSLNSCAAIIFSA